MFAGLGRASVASDGVRCTVQSLETKMSRVSHPSWVRASGRWWVEGIIWGKYGVGGEVVMRREVGNSALHRS